MAIFAPLVVLALIDSTSFGTLLVPIWFLMLPGKLRLLPMIAYLLTVSVLYFAVGTALMFGADLAMKRFASFFESDSFAYIMFGVGIVLFIISFRYTRKQIEKRREKNKGKPNRMNNWRSRIFENDRNGAFAKSLVSVAGLAITAVAIELVTMLPYLSAIGIIKSTVPSMETALAILACYCAVMVVPALLLTMGRLVAYNKIAPLLIRIDGWFEREGEYTIGWILGAIGVVIILNTVTLILNAAGIIL